MSIRSRLTLAVALVLIATFVVLGVVLIRSTRATLVAQVDDQVRAVAVRGAKGPPPGGGPAQGSGQGSGQSNAPPPGDADRIGGAAAQPTPAAATTTTTTTDLFEHPVARYIYSAGGSLVHADPAGFADQPKPPPRLPPIPSPALDALCNRIVTLPATDGSLSYRVLVQRDDNNEIVVTAAPLTAANDALARLERILVGGGLAALLVATLACWWLIRRGLRPVDRMVETAAAIAGGDLGRRVPDANPRTELGRLGGALNEMLHQIERALAARAASEARLRRFVADAAHELRTPLTSLRGYAELHRQGALPGPEGAAQAMRRIEAEGARMQRLVDELLLLARLDQQRGLETTPVDVVAVVREAVTDFHVIDPDRPLTAEFVDAAVVRGDRGRLRQVIDNLLANARTHTPPGTPVHVTVRRVGNEVEIAVADEGPGIAAQDRERVFERFWRADPARSRSKGGTGLGLAIVASLVQAHGGTVGVASEPGCGATFTVRLPLLSADGAGAAERPTAMPAAEPASSPALRLGGGAVGGAGGGAG